MKINNFLELKDFKKVIINNEKIELDESLLPEWMKVFSF
jgi:histidine ammonia-lyase